MLKIKFLGSRSRRIVISRCLRLPIRDLNVDYSTKKIDINFEES